MPRSIIRHVEWTCSPEPASPVPMYEFECTTCQDRGQCSENFETARQFAFDHVGPNPGHQGFREVVTRYWRMRSDDVAEPARSGAAPCLTCNGRGERVNPGSSAPTECRPCEGTGNAQ